MKKGDIILCKKNISYNEQQKCFVANKCYKVLDVSFTNCVIEDAYRDEFYFNRNNQGGHYIFDIEDSFYTEKQVRKIKLERLNED